MTKVLHHFFKNKKCVVAGNGFVGSHLVDQLLDYGAIVRVVSRQGKSHRNSQNLEIVKADLLDFDNCEKILTDQDAIFQAAGSVGASGVGPDSLMNGIRINLSLTANLAQAAWKKNIKFLQLYGSSTAYPCQDTPITEDKLFDGPVFPSYLGYGWMRRYIEKLAEFVASNSSVKVSIVRPSALYGPRDNFDPVTSHVIAALIQRALEGTTDFYLRGDGQEVRDILHVKDFARGCLLTMAQKSDCDPINIASGIGITTYDLARKVLDLCGRTTDSITLNPAPMTAIGCRILDITKARKELGFQPIISLDNGLAEVISWYKKTYL
jgi:GDP-L-fucose synthase